MIGGCIIVFLMYRRVPFVERSVSESVNLQNYVPAIDFAEDAETTERQKTTADEFYQYTETRIFPRFAGTDKKRGNTVSV